MVILQPSKYDIDPPAETITTQKIPKPQPETEPHTIWEMNSLLDTSGIGGGKDRAVLFSGGDDSLALTHMAFSNDWADLVIHLATGSEIPENLDYVRRVCTEFEWPLLILKSPLELETFGCRYGFPGAGAHNMAYNYFKSRQLAQFYQHREGSVKFISGVRRQESNRRMENIEAEVQYEDASDDGNFTGWWVSPLIDKSDEWVHKYREAHQLPRNPVSEKIHRSGDCQCLSFGHRGQELAIIEAKYPKFGRWLRNVERRVQEYRGRVMFLEEQYQDAYARVDELRKQERPNPMRLTVLKNEYPGIFDEIVGVPAETAILKGQTDTTNYLGHGGLSSQELRSLVAQADTCQQTLCETCQEPSDGIVKSVQQQRKHAASALEDVSKTVQTEITQH